MTESDRRFLVVLLLTFGALFIAGGWLAAFTAVGAMLIYTGTAMLLAAPILLRSLKVGSVSLGLLALGWGMPWVASL
jgi:hypothetical protein